MASKTQYRASALRALVLGGVYAGVAVMSVQAGCGGSPQEVPLTTADQALKGGLLPLSQVPVPQPVGGDVVDKQAAVRLGKALFWDQQVGSDGQMSCASCHFQAGTDSRRKNIIHPGPDATFEASPGAGVMWTLKSITSDDRVGSQGVHSGLFRAIAADPSNAVDDCAWDNSQPPYYAERSVTGRQTPSAIGAIFNRQNFWDGRANDVFNGLNPFGGTGNARAQELLEANARAPGLSPEDRGGGGGGGGGGRVIVANASTASAALAVLSASTSSQAVGPPLSGVEMSCAGRAFNGANSLGAKLLARTPLGKQLVSATDSVLGALSNAPGKGLRCGTGPCTYTAMIAAAFGPTLAVDAVNQFSRLFGQAIQAYESTLIPDQTPFDKYLAGNGAALTASQQKGLSIFSGKANCTQCHTGAELTDASISFFNSNGSTNRDNGDQGFHNLGVRPTAEDPGRGGTGPGGVAWSQSRSPADMGAFKTPSLRNVKLTAPYFHNGGKPTLAEVVAFYNRGGDFANAEKARDLRPLNLGTSDQAALVDFLANGLTDCRVEMHQAPFDHPSLSPPDGDALAAAGAAGYGPCR